MTLDSKTREMVESLADGELVPIAHAHAYELVAMARYFLGHVDMHHDCGERDIYGWGDVERGSAALAHLLGAMEQPDGERTRLWGPLLAKTDAPAPTQPTQAKKGTAPTQAQSAPASATA